MCLKTTQRSLHGLSETLQPQLLTCALGRRARSSAGVTQHHPVDVMQHPFGGVTPIDTFPVDLVLNLEWIYRGFTMKGRELNQLWQGTEEHPEGSYLPRLLPRPASLCTNVNE